MKKKYYRLDGTVEETDVDFDELKKQEKEKKNKQNEERVNNAISTRRNELSSTGTNTLNTLESKRNNPYAKSQTMSTNNVVGLAQRNREIEANKKSYQKKEYKQNEESLDRAGKTVGNTLLNVGEGAYIETNNIRKAIKSFRLGAEKKGTDIIGKLTGQEDKANKINQKSEKTNYEDLHTSSEEQLADFEYNFNRMNEDERQDYEDNSTVKRDNLAGQVARGVGGMLPAIAVNTALNVATGGITVPYVAVTGTTGQKAAAIGKNLLVKAINSTTTGLATGAAAYTGGYEQALQSGADEETAKKYGFLSGLNELATEGIADGIPGFRPEGSSELLDKVVDKVTGNIKSDFLKKIASIGIKYGANGVGEGIEEWVSDAIDPTLQRMTYNPDAKFDSEDAAKSFLVGMLTSYILDSPSLVSEINSSMQRNETTNAKVGEATTAYPLADYNLNQNNMVAEEMTRIANGQNESDTAQNAQDTTLSTQNTPDLTQNAQEPINTSENVNTTQNGTNSALNETLNNQTDNIVEQQLNETASNDVRQEDIKDSVNALNLNEKVDNSKIKNSNSVITEDVRKDVNNFSKQVDDVIAGNYSKGNMLTLLSKTPKPMLDIGLQDLPITMTQKHLNTIMNKSGADKNANYHGLGIDLVKKLPEAINNPLDIVESKTKKGSIVLTTDLSDSQDRSVIASIKINGNGHVNDVEIDTNVMTSAYGKDNYDSFMKNNIDEGRLLYDIDRGAIRKINENTKKGATSTRLQLPGRSNSIDENISKTKNNVKHSETNMSSNDSIPLKKADDLVISKKGDHYELQNGTTYENKTATASDGTKVSNFYENITEKSKFLSEDYRSKLAKEEFYNYIPKSNTEVVDRVLDSFSKNGAEKMVLDFFTNKVPSAEDTATGWILLKSYQDAGNYEMVTEVAKTMREKGTRAGQAIQMYDLQARLSPEAMGYLVNSELINGQKEWSKGKSKKEIEAHAQDFELTPDDYNIINTNMKNVQKIQNGTINEESLQIFETNNYAKKYNEKLKKAFEKYQSEGNTKAIEALAKDTQKVQLAQIKQMVANKLPRSNGQAFNSWMRLSMLGNLKTQVRNVGSNAISLGMGKLSDIPGSLVDKVLASKTGYRTTGSDLQIKESVEGFVEGGRQAYRDYRLGIDTKDLDINKFSLKDARNTKAFNNSTNLKVVNEVNRVLNASNDVLDLAMSGGDRVFYQAIFARSLANQMELNNATVATKEMIEIAREEALQRTWNDSNAYTKFVLDIRKGLNQIGSDKLNYGLGDVLIPFAKTPANLTKAMVDYSPAGLVKTVIDIPNIKNAIETGQMTRSMQHTFAQNMGKGIAGTVLYILGTALAKAKITRGANDDDKDVAEYEKNVLGLQPYSIKIGNKTFTYDWIQPYGTAFAITADAVKASETEDDKSTLEKILNIALKSGNIALEQLMEQSFMQSIAEVLGSGSYGTSDVFEGITKQILSLPARAIPTLVQQIATMADPTKRQTYVSGDIVGNAKRSTEVKIPGVKSTLSPSVNSMGDELQSYGGNEDPIAYAYRVFASPANYAESTETKEGREAYSVYESTGNKYVLPQKADNSVTLDDKSSKKLSTEEKTKYQKTSGKIYKNAVGELLESDDYASLSDDEKAEVLSSISKFADAMGKESVGGKESSTYNKPRAIYESGYSIADYYLYKTINKSTSTTTSTKTTEDYATKYQSAARYGITQAQYEDASTYVANVKGDSEGTANRMTKKEKVRTYIESMRLTAEAKAYLWEQYLNNGKL